MMIFRVLLAIVLAALTSPALAERYAVLIGVADYEAMDDLNGPGNDVELMLSVLPHLQYSNVQVLTDAPIDGARRPSLENIENVFEVTLTAIKPGDSVMIYMSGHGTRVSDENADEGDGFDETFLPIDAHYNNRGGIANALLDDDIGTFLDAIRSRGVDVWLIMDSCFSASGARAPDPRLRGKDVPPAGEPARVSMTETTSTSELGEDAGYLVAFYAAQAYERAWEYNFGPGPDGAPVWHGIFTTKLVDRLKHGSAGVSYQQLYEGVLMDMADSGIVGDGTIQTPYIETAGLVDEAELPGGVRQFPIVDGVLSAGLVQGLAPGSILAVFDDPGAFNDQSLGHVRVRVADAVTSTFEPVSATCVTGDDTCAVLIGDAAGFTARSRYARIVAPSLDTVLRLSAPIPLDGSSPEALTAVLTAAATFASSNLSTPIGLDSGSPDLMVGLSNGRIWFAGSEGFRRDTEQPSNIGWRPSGDDREDALELAGILHRAAKAQNLIKIANALYEQQGGGGPQLALDIILRPSDPASLWTAEAIAGAGNSYKPQQECAEARYLDPVPLAVRSTLKQCDRLQVRVVATGLTVAKDVNVIYVDANFGIKVFYRRLNPPDARVTMWEPDPMFCSECPLTDGGFRSVYGPEMLMVISADAVAHQRPLDLSDLRQLGLPRAKAGDPPPNPLLTTLLTLSASGTKARDVFPAPATPASVALFRWDLLVRESATSQLHDLPDAQ
ncbi:caspase family protein [Devosia sp. 1566]|uniref:caspase family protein n=1 Tax=Devosia sp. 1566 TaxID=2499144 RepID=UPI000FD729E5|nr:caspase family protein [Devosia sp. 1566]